MKKFIIKLGEKLFIPACTMIICYCIFRKSLIYLPHIRIIQYVIFGLGFIIATSGFIQLFSKPLNKKKTSKTSSQKESVIDFLNRSSEYIVNYIFSIYFFVYLVFKLDEKSLLFNYLMLLIFGIFIGYRIAIKTGDASNR